MSVIKQKLSDSLKEAMKARDEVRTGTIRMMISEIKKRDIDYEIKGKPAMDDNEAMGVLLTMVKQRRESSATYVTANRPELAAKEDVEIGIIEQFLPKQLGDAEAKAKIQAIVQQLGANGPKDMGKVMAAVKEQLVGQFDMSKASALVKEVLSAAA